MIAGLMPTQMRAGQQIIPGLPANRNLGAFNGYIQGQQLRALQGVTLPNVTNYHRQLTAIINGMSNAAWVWCIIQQILQTSQAAEHMFNPKPRATLDDVRLSPSIMISNLQSMVRRWLLYYSIWARRAGLYLQRLWQEYDMSLINPKSASILTQRQLLYEARAITGGAQVGTLSS